MEELQCAEPDSDSRESGGLGEKSVKSEVYWNRIARVLLVHRELLFHRKDVKNSQRVWISII